MRRAAGRAAALEPALHWWSRLGRASGDEVAAFAARLGSLGTTVLIRPGELSKVELRDLAAELGLPGQP